MEFVDRRNKEKVKLSDMAVKLGLELIGNGEREIIGIASPEYPAPGRVCVIWDKSAIKKLPAETAIIGKAEYFAPGRDGLISPTPRESLPMVAALFPAHSGLRPQRGVSPLAFVSPDAVVSPEASVSPFAFIGPGCYVGDMSVICPNATLVHDVRIGKGCIIHSGAVLGADGFGFERTSSGVVKIPQTGGVMIGDDVEIGACATVDCGTLDDTVIGSGTKIDNQVQIGHNAKIGRNCIICSMSGIAGSSVIEDNVTISVQAGVTDHVRIGANTIIGGRAGVTHDIPPDSIISGFPARNHNDAKRALVLATDLPLIVKRLRILEREMEELRRETASR